VEKDGGHGSCEATISKGLDGLAIFLQVKEGQEVTFKRGEGWQWGETLMLAFCFRNWARCSACSCPEVDKGLGIGEYGLDGFQHTCQLGRQL
jgi:hypothetical protein